jgi:hypothetical protein
MGFRNGKRTWTERNGNTNHGTISNGFGTMHSYPPWQQIRVDNIIIIHNAKSFSYAFCNINLDHIQSNNNDATHTPLWFDVLRVD